MLSDMRFGCLALLLALLLACNGDDSSKDLGADLSSGQEGLSFPDLGGEGSAKDLSTDDEDVTDMDAAADVAAGDAVPDAPADPDMTPTVDLAPDGPVAPPCSLFSQFTCVTSPTSSIRCEAKCTGGGASYQITCSTLVALCGCSKNGNPVGSCAQSGKGCTACQSAFSCCTKYY
jgi:hypothetical protein